MSGILVIAGTRPEIIKLAPVYHALRTRYGSQVSWLHTGQHDEMARQMLSCFDITPDIRFDRDCDSLAAFSTACKAQLDQVLSSRRWDLVVVQGDTESAFLGALCGFHHRVAVVHVEAGLRTYNLERPFPEEGLRQMISRIASYHYAPTPRARQALLDEAIAEERIIVTGNTVIDAQQWISARHKLRRRAVGRGHLLVTAHRRENWGHDMAEICHSIAAFAGAHPELEVLFPVHLNPVVKQPVHAILGGLANVTLTEPLDYLQMQQALLDAWMVLTDSGGLQEEAPTYGVPLLVLREETERPEAIEAGCACLAGTRRQSILEGMERLWSDPQAYWDMQRAGNPFGDGRASERIVQHIEAAMIGLAGDRKVA